MKNSELYNMIWTAGFNSGLRASMEGNLGKLDTPEKLQARANELMNQDAEGIEVLVNLKLDMEHDERERNK